MKKTRDSVMDGALPTEFDVIIIGTGFIESLLSAAISRNGKQVLQIDSKDYYGGHWTSASLESVNKVTANNYSSDASEESNNLLEASETVLCLGNDKCILDHVEIKWHLENLAEKEKVPEDESLKETKDLVDNANVKKEWTQETLLENSRKFNIDLSPKLHFARGNFVELMISANLSRYSEFRSVSRILTWLNGNLESVPCSRSDVFSNDKVSVIEKRMLMKLLIECVDKDEKEFIGCENKTFYSYLREHKLTDNLIHYVLYTIAMSTKETSCLDGISRTKRFLGSLGRFGKTPLLYAMYGSGDIPQAFCRCSAVFGGVFALNQNIKLVMDKEDKFKGVLCGNQKINAKYLIISAEKAPKSYVKHIEPTYISRATFITDKSILETEREHLTLLVLPPDNGKNTSVLIEMGHLTGTCPKDTYLIHMIAKRKTNPIEDFSECVEKLFKMENAPKILWSLYYSMPDTNNCDLNAHCPDNVILCPGPDLDLDYDNSIAKAKSIFEQLYPGEPFFPRVPDPEEIVFDGNDEQDTTSGNAECGDNDASAEESTTI